MGHTYSDTVPDLLTPAQLAARLGTTKTTVQEWYHAGKIPAEIAEGQTYRYDYERVRKALADRATKPAP